MCACPRPQPVRIKTGDPMRTFAENFMKNRQNLAVWLPKMRGRDFAPLPAPSKNKEFWRPVRIRLRNDQL